MILVLVLALLAVLLWPAGSGLLPRPGPGGESRASRGSRARGGVGALARLATRRRSLPAEQHLRFVATSLDSLAAALGAGIPTAQAVRLVSVESARSGSGWAPLLEAADRGESLAPVWRRLAREWDLPDLVVVASAWQVSERLGAPLAEAVRTSAAGMRARADAAAALRAGTAGARASAGLLTGLPLVGVGLALVLGIPPDRLYGAPVPLISLTAAAVLVLVGRRWTRAQLAAVPRRAARRESPVRRAGIRRPPSRRPRVHG